ncbi:hypothetical protein ABZW10_11415 [Kitasatospora sp. NPDC004723]|uniref:hypothetical protein n=1 Tax=Kitasatospora sp. NPDC004723 TaxID=3154288 RepID=UPI0033BCC528
MIENSVTDSHAQIIVQAGTIAGGITLPAPPSPPVPRLLPRRRPLADRVEARARLSALLSTEEPLPVLITGPEGMGKTALAVDLLHGQNTPGPHLHADLGGSSASGPTRPDAIIARWLRALGVGVPTDADEAHDLYRSLTAGRRVAVLLDDVATAVQAERLLPSACGLVIITARRPLPELLAAGTHHHRLGPLPADAAGQLLLSVAGRALPHHRIAELTEACQGIPQALALAGARLAVGVPTVLPEPRTESIVSTALTGTYATLDATAARVYRIAGLLPSADTTVDFAMAGAAARLDPATTEAAFSSLAQAQLLVAPSTDTGRWEFVSSGVRAHAAARAAEEEDEGQAVRRALDWLTAETMEAARLAVPYRDPLAAPLSFPPPHRVGITTPTQALDFLRVRGPHLDAALTAAETHHPVIVPHLVFAAWPHYLRARHYREWLDHHDRALAALTALGTPATDTGRRLYRELLGGRATVLRALNRVPDALADCHQALATAKQTDDRAGIAQHHHDLGAAYRQAAAHALARQHFSRARTLYLDLGRPRGAALAHLELALTDAVLGEDAATVLDRLSVAERGLLATGDPLNSSKARAWRGRILATDGRGTDARPVLASALDGFREQDARLWEARILVWLADIDRERGRTGDAITLLRHAAALYEHHSPADHAEVTAVLRDLRSRA